MHKLYPLKFTPIFRDKIWGGQKVRTHLGMDFGELPNCGEVWVVSGVEGNVSEVSNGYLKGNELNELVEVFMDDLVGDRIYQRFGDEFPLLIKFIDSNDWLSIQVHPGDELAARRNIGYGKTEMWYVIDADDRSELINGFNKPMDADGYKVALENGKIRDIMNFEQVSKGDVFFIPAGRVHALGPGILLAEIQQTSDTTYRIYDWDRKDEQGRSRDLHIAEALEAIDFSSHQQYKTDYKEVRNQGVGLVENDKFTTNLVYLDDPLHKNYNELDSFVIYIGLEGRVEMDWGEGQLNLLPGEAVVKPAVLPAMSFKPHEASRFLEVYIN